MTESSKHTRQFKSKKLILARLYANSTTVVRSFFHFFRWPLVNGGDKIISIHMKMEHDKNGYQVIKRQLWMCAIWIFPCHGALDQCSLTIALKVALNFRLVFLNRSMRFIAAVDKPVWFISSIAVIVGMGYVHESLHDVCRWSECVR